MPRDAAGAGRGVMQWYEEWCFRPASPQRYYYY